VPEFREIAAINLASRQNDFTSAIYIGRAGKHDAIACGETKIPPAGQLLKNKIMATKPKAKKPVVKKPATKKKK
jgi:hypothetical protein